MTQTYPMISYDFRSLLNALWNSIILVIKPGLALRSRIHQEMYSHPGVHGCFRKWWYPQIIHFGRIFHYKPASYGGTHILGNLHIELSKDPH